MVGVALLRRMATAALLVAAVGTMGAQGSVDAQRRELDRMKRSIEQTRTRITALNRKESSAMRSLTSVQRQRHQLAVFIGSLEHDLAALQDSAQVLEQQIRTTQSSLERVEVAYGAATRRLLALRARYPAEHRAGTEALFRSMSATVAAHRRSMQSLEDSLKAQQSVLDDVVGTQAYVLAEKTREQRRLASTITASQRELEKLRSDKTKLKSELASKQKSARSMRTIISGLVAKEERRRKEQAERRAEEQRQAEQRRRQRTPAGTATPPARTAPSTPEPPTRAAFGAGSLPWPVASRTILHGYGTYTNEASGTVFDNPGIDIACPVGSTVSCAGNGTVSSIQWLPGFGSVVIVDHGNGMRTVYANLAGVSVKQGAAVRTGSPIGTSGESVDGAFMHFEVWKGRERTNPATYLR